MINIPISPLPQIADIIRASESNVGEPLTYGRNSLSGLYEVYIVLITGGASSGAAQSFFTDATTYQNLNPSRFRIDPSSYPGASFFLEAVFRAGASGDPLRTFFMDLYDLTAGATITNSEISSTQTEGAAGPGSLPRLRGSTNFRGNMTSGFRDYILRYRSDTATRFVDLYYARFVIVYS